MTTGSTLISRVRSNILESTANQRTDAEILQWLNEGQLVYLQALGSEAFEELFTTTYKASSQLSLPTDYLLFHDLTVRHTVTGTYTETCSAFMVKPSELHIQQVWAGNLGAWCYIQGGVIKAAPQVFAMTLSYVKSPSMSTSASTFQMREEHEPPIVAYASHMACLKINDADADKWLGIFTTVIQARTGKALGKDVAEA